MTKKEIDRNYVIFLWVAWLLINGIWIVWCLKRFGIELVLILALALIGLVSKGLLIEENRKYKKKYKEEIFGKEK